MGVVSCLSAIGRQFCIEKSRWEFEFCPLSGIEKRPLLGGCFSITTMLISIRNTELVRCREVVRFSEGPLSEARLYLESLLYKTFSGRSSYVALHTTLKNSGMQLIEAIQII